MPSTTLSQYVCHRTLPVMQKSRRNAVADANQLRACPGDDLPWVEEPFPVTEELRFQGHRAPVTATAIHPEMKQVASGSSDGVLFLWQLRLRERPFRFIVPGTCITSVDFSPVQAEVASGSDDGVVRVWSNNSRGTSSSMKAHTNRIRSVRYSPCGRLLLTAADDKLAKLWDATSRTFVASLRRHHRWVMCARWGPQARVIATGADDASVILWDADTQQPLMQLSMTSGTVHDCAFNPEGTLVASCCSNSSVVLWDTRLGRSVRQFAAGESAVTAVDIDLAGRLLVAATAQGSLLLFDILGGGLPLWSAPAHTGGINCARFAHQSVVSQAAAGCSPDGCTTPDWSGFFVSGGNDGAVLAWQSHQTPAGNAVLALPLPQAATTVKRPAVATPRTGTVAPPTPRRATLTTPPTHRDTCRQTHTQQKERTATPPQSVSHGKAPSVLSMQQTPRRRQPLRSTSLRTASGPAGGGNTKGDLGPSLGAAAVQEPAWQQDEGRSGTQVTYTGCMPSELQDSLASVAAQVDVVVDTLQLLERRLKITEDAVTALSSSCAAPRPLPLRNNFVANKSPANPHPTRSAAPSVPCPAATTKDTTHGFFSPTTYPTVIPKPAFRSKAPSYTPSASPAVASPLNSSSPTDYPNNPDGSPQRSPCCASRTPSPRARDQISGRSSHTTAQPGDGSSRAGSRFDGLCESDDVGVLPGHSALTGSQFVAVYDVAPPSHAFLGSLAKNLSTNRLAKGSDPIPPFLVN
eukprot:GHVT01095204.1.p1 GENE.GHVT01095204.1~~GHVT01095204.1.p1  ORF type:complete len:748 (+),score=83.60 GHVT01095204.1:406-2649(+)